jgi:hypothetical protein
VDDAPIHIGKFAGWYKQKTMVQGFDRWPLNSPDWNLIEHKWVFLKLRTNKCSINVTKIEEFEEIARDEWANINPSYLEALIVLLPTRCANVIAANGATQDSNSFSHIQTYNSKHYQLLFCLI